MPSACHLFFPPGIYAPPCDGGQVLRISTDVSSWQRSRFSAWDSPIFKKIINHPGDWNPGWCKIMKFTGCFVTFVQHLQVVQDVSSTESSLSNDVFFPEKAGVSRWLPGDISHFTQKYPLCHGSTRPQKFQIPPTSYIFANLAKITYL